MFGVWKREVKNCRRMQLSNLAKENQRQGNGGIAKGQKLCEASGLSSAKRYLY